jgi:hypothetical protein
MYAAAAPMSAASEPPYRYHWPAAVLVMMMLPLGRPMDSTNEAMIQPMAGANPPPNVRVPQPASTQVAKMSTANMIATSGTGLRL